jgi:acetolactate synthase I/II/III large subunit
VTEVATQVTFAEAIARALAAEGATDVFGIMGSGNTRVLHHLEHDLEVAYHAARHEAGAVAAADGFARATGRVGVCIVTQGPGLTNTITPLITARKANSPVVLLTGDSSGINTPEDRFARVQAVPYETLLAAADVPVVRAEPATAARDVHDALAMAARDLTPVALVMPYQHEVAEAGDAPVVAAEPPVVAEPDPAELNAAVERLCDAERPLVLAGRGAFRAGLFRGHPADLGLVGGFARPSVQEAVNACDVVLAVGAGLNGFTTHQETLMADAHVIHVDRHPRAFGRHRGVSSTVTGDTRVVAEALIARVPGRDGVASSVRQVPEVVRGARAAAVGPVRGRVDAGPARPACAVRPAGCVAALGPRGRDRRRALRVARRAPGAPGVSRRAAVHAGVRDQVTRGNLVLEVPAIAAFR